MLHSVDNGVKDEKNYYGGALKNHILRGGGVCLEKGRGLDSLQI